jgi:hypothetical protein
MAPGTEHDFAPLAIEMTNGAPGISGILSGSNEQCNKKIRSCPE